MKRSIIWVNVLSRIRTKRVALMFLGLGEIEAAVAVGIRRYT